MIYNKEQNIAIEKCIEFIKYGNPNEYFLIEGKAGTGKTTVIKEVLKHFKNKKIIVGALSHKAKYVIKESIEIDDSLKNISYSSIAGMLNMQLDLETGVFKKIYSNKYKNENRIGKTNIIIIDEASMVNEEMIDLLFKEKNKKAKLIFLGDIGQLPPIRTKTNDYFRDWTEEELSKNSPIFNTNNKVKLLERVRQGENSPILPFADFFWENTQKENPSKNPANIKYRKTIINNNGALIFVNQTKEIFDQILNIYEISIKENKQNLIKFLSYKNNTRYSINKYVHKHFFGDKSKTFEKGELIIFNDNFGDIENSSEFQIIEKYPDFIESIYNLKLYSVDIEFENKLHQLVLLHPDSYDQHQKIIKDKFNEAFRIKKVINNMDVNNPNYNKDMKILNDGYIKKLKDAWDEKIRFPNIDHAYSLTVHKSQGSTYDIVVVHEKDIMDVKPISNKQKSQSIYTALTRAKNITIVISNEIIYENDLNDINLIEINNNIEKNKYKK